MFSHVVTVIQFAANRQHTFIYSNVSGYRDIHLTMRADNGHLCEIQLNVESIVKVKDQLHDLYKISRGIDAENIPAKHKKKIKDTLNGIMHDAYEFSYNLALKPKGGQTSDRAQFIASVSSIIEPSSEIFSLMSKPSTSDKLSPVMRNILSEAKSATKATPSALKKALLGPRSDNFTNDTSKVRFPEDSPSTNNITTKDAARLSCAGGFGWCGYQATAAPFWVSHHRSNEKFPSSKTL